MNLTILCICICAIIGGTIDLIEYNFCIDGDFFMAMLVGALVGFLVSLLAFILCAGIASAESTPYAITDQEELIQVLPDTYLRLIDQGVTYQTASKIKTVRFSSIKIEYSSTETPSIRTEHYKIDGSFLRWLLNDMDAKTTTIVVIPEGSLR